MNYIDLENWASYTSIALRQRHSKMVGLLPAPKQFRQDQKHTNRTAMIRFSCTL